MYPALTQYIEEVEMEMHLIPDARQEELRKIADFIQQKRAEDKVANLVFICTHNSRRSHFGQIWAATAANYHDLGKSIETFSGGTEVTAFNSKAVSALERAGFEVESPDGENPHYLLYFDEDAQPLECFSKKFDDPANPSNDFVAAMTCSHADENCPFIPGASLRVSIPYDDPKEADGTPEESARYNERCWQIATEMFYLIEQVKK